MMRRKKQIRILLVDDHKLIRNAMRRMIEYSFNMVVAAETGDGRSAVHLAEQLSPDVVIIDIGMPVLNGFEATRQIIARCPKTRVIALSGYSEPQFVAEMIASGAIGYLTKNCEIQEIAQAINMALKGQLYLDSRLSARIVQKHLDALPTLHDRASPVLSTREREVVKLYAEGFTTRHIAENLYISVKTVESHRSHIMKKLNINSVAEMTRYAIREAISFLMSLLFLNLIS